MQKFILKTPLRRKNPSKKSLDIRNQAIKNKVDGAEDKRKQRKSQKTTASPIESYH